MNSYLCTVMQEFFFTLLSVWVIWQLYRAFSSPPRNTAPRYEQHTHHHHYNDGKKKEGEVKVEMKQPNKARLPDDEGEYVDYEDIK